MKIQQAICEVKKNAINKIRGAFEFAMQYYEGDQEKEIRNCFEEGIDELIDPSPAAKQLIRKEFDRLVAALSANHSLLSSIEIKLPNKKDDR